MTNRAEIVNKLQALLEEDDPANDAEVHRLSARLEELGKETKQRPRSRSRSRSRSPVARSSVAVKKTTTTSTSSAVKKPRPRSRSRSRSPMSRSTTSVHPSNVPKASQYKNGTIMVSRTKIPHFFKVDNSGRWTLVEGMKTIEHEDSRFYPKESKFWPELVQYPAEIQRGDTESSHGPKFQTLPAKNGLYVQHFYGEEKPKNILIVPWKRPDKSFERVINVHEPLEKYEHSDKDSDSDSE